MHVKWAVSTKLEGSEGCGSLGDTSEEGSVKRSVSWRPVRVLHVTEFSLPVLRIVEPSVACCPIRILFDLNCQHACCGGLLAAVCFSLHFQPGHLGGVCFYVSTGVKSGTSLRLFVKLAIQGGPFVVLRWPRVRPYFVSKNL